MKKSSNYNEVVNEFFGANKISSTTNQPVRGRLGQAINAAIKGVGSAVGAALKDPRGVGNNLKGGGIVNTLKSVGGKYKEIIDKESKKALDNYKFRVNFPDGLPKRGSVFEIEGEDKYIYTGKVSLVSRVGGEYTCVVETVGSPTRAAYTEPTAPPQKAPPAPRNLRLAPRGQANPAVPANVAPNQIVKPGPRLNAENNLKFSSVYRQIIAEQNDQSPRRQYTIQIIDELNPYHVITIVSKYYTQSKWFGLIPGKKIKTVAPYKAPGETQDHGNGMFYDNERKVFIINRQMMSTEAFTLVAVSGNKLKPGDSFTGRDIDNRNFTGIVVAIKTLNGRRFATVKGSYR